MRGRTILLILSPFILIILLSILLIGLLQSAGMMTLNLAASLMEIGIAPELARAAQNASNIINYLNFPLRILFIPVIFFLAYIFHRLNWRIAGWLLKSPFIQSIRNPKIILQEESRLHDPSLEDPNVMRHQQTLQHLIANLVSLSAFSLAIFLTLLQFINSAGLAIIATVASTALGFGARDYINDIIMGITEIFENDFNVGEKVEILRIATHLEGVVLKVNVRTTTMQSPEGVPMIIPHGEMRVLRNFSRGHFSSTTISFPVPSADLAQVLEILENLSAESLSLFPDLIEPLQIISRTGVIGSQTDLLVLGKAIYGHGKDLRLQLFNEIETRLNMEQTP